MPAGMSGYVLIVESDPELQRKIGDALREARYELAAEAEAAWARRSITVRTPDAIVVDTVLSDGDGFRLAEDLRRDPDTRDTPIFFVASRFRGASHRAEARRRFAPAEYLPTPIDVNSLLALILQAVPPAGGQPAPAGSAGRASVAPPPPHAADLQETPGPIMTPPPSAASILRSPKDPAQQRERRDVERSAKTLTVEKAELSGTLKRVPFARVLRRLYTQRASGSLLMLRESTKKIVSFVDGYPVSVRSNVLGETLGQILLGQKSISGQALAESVARLQKEKRHQGEILVEMGALSPFNLSRALVEQVEAKLFEIFSWREGQFMFKEGDAPPKEALRLGRPPAALILEGIRRHYDSSRQVAVLEGFVGHYVTLNADPMLRLQEMTSDPTELDFIRQIDGSQRLEAILDRAAIPRDKARLLLVALSEAGMIAPADAPIRRTGATPTPAPAPAPPAGAPGSGGEESVDIELSGGREQDGDGDQEGDGEQDGDGEDLVEVSRSAGSAPKTMPLGVGQLSMVVQTVRTQDYFWALGVERAASSEQVDHAYEALAQTFHADRYRTSPDDDRRMAQEIFDRLSEAHRVLRDPSRRRAYAERLDHPDKKTDRPLLSSGDAGGSGVGAPGNLNSAGNAAARAFYDSGMEHLKARRHHEAVEAFRQAARLVPGEADYRAALGWSLFREAPVDARAGRAALAELRRAVQIDGSNRRALHYLANFYAETGQADRAIEELEKVLKIDPASTEAADQLRRLRGR
jgi:DNA-binding response OmpR family regulator/tetratricopeptide (TPR) repeat protein